MKNNIFLYKLQAYRKVTLNSFIKLYARKTHERGGSKTFLAIKDDTDEILGFYTLSPASISYENAPAEIKKNLARHDVPVFRLGRLAIDLKFQNNGLGGQLLLAAGKRCLKVSMEVGGVAMLINAKNKKVAKWYTSYGATSLLDDPLSLVIPLETIKSALIAEKKL